MYSLAVIVLLVLPASHAYSTRCSVNLPVADRNEISGQYSSEGWMISFHALLKDGKIEAVTTFKKTTAVLKGDEEEYEFSINLSFQDLGGRVIPEIEKHTLVAARELVKATGCKFPDNVIEMYEEMADELYRCTTELGTIQIRYGIMYHVSVVGTAQRICYKKASICTPSPKYLYGEGVFICLEDLLYFKEHGEPERSVRKHDEKDMISGKENHDSELNVRKHEEKRQLLGTILCPFHGRDICCCGSYDFICLYCHIGCCLHDIACWCCRSWWCLWGCESEQGCSNAL